MKHSNDKYGSMATPCRRCGLEFAFQITQDGMGWAGLPCKTTPYTNKELFAINRAYITTMDDNDDFMSDAEYETWKKESEALDMAEELYLIQLKEGNWDAKYGT